MKTIRGLSKQPEMIEEGKGLNNAYHVFRIYMKNFVGKALAKSADDAVERLELVKKLTEDKDEFELEDAEFKLLKKSVEENHTQIQAHVQAQCYNLIRVAEKEAEEKDKKDKEKK